MVANTDIKFYVHTNSNAPQLQNVYGSMINVLDACLINGINIGTISSLTASGKIVTALFSSAHNLMQYQVIKITGANQTEFNVEARILTIPNATTVTFELAAAPSVSTATGTINCSLPPIGWEKTFSSSNPSGGGKAAYRTTNLLLPSRPFLRVVDELDPAYNSSYAKYAKVGMVENMTDIDTISGAQVPYSEANPNKNWVATGSGESVRNGWAKWYYARYALVGGTADQTAPPAGNRAWIIVGNKDYFYISNITTASENKACIYGFGSFDTFCTTDTGNHFLSACITNSAANEFIYPADYGGLGSGQVKNYALYNLSASATNQELSNSATTLVANLERSGESNDAGYTSDAPIMFYPVYCLETNVVRGAYTNLYWLKRKVPYANKQLIVKNDGVYIAISCVVYNSFDGQVIIKVADL